MTEKEKRTVLAVFGDLLMKGDDFMHKFIGSETIKDLKEIYSRLRYEDYCNKHGIKYEDMTDEDFEQAYREEWEY